MATWKGRDDWSSFEQQQWERMAAGQSVLNDKHLQEVYDVAFFNRDVTPDQRRAARGALRILLENEYNINLDDVFDWDAWRERYADDLL